MILFHCIIGVYIVLGIWLPLGALTLDSDDCSFCPCLNSTGVGTGAGAGAGDLTPVGYCSQPPDKPKLF